MERNFCLVSSLDQPLITHSVHLLGAMLPLDCSQETLAFVKPLKSVVGRDEAKPAVIMLKKTPILTSEPEFWNVARIPDATPR